MTHHTTTTHSCPPMPLACRLQVVSHFRLLGRCVAKALQDGRLLDLPLSPLLYRLALGRSAVDLYDVRRLDAGLGERGAARRRPSSCAALSLRWSDGVGGWVGGCGALESVINCRADDCSPLPPNGCQNLYRRLPGAPARCVPRARGVGRVPAGPAAGRRLPPGGPVPHLGAARLPPLPAAAPLAAPGRRRRREAPLRCAALRCAALCW